MEQQAKYTRRNHADYGYLGYDKEDDWVFGDAR
jgi:hypothetical protein